MTIEGTATAAPDGFTEMDRRLYDDTEFIFLTPAPSG
jgi:hypothetical protein